MIAKNFEEFMEKSVNAETAVLNSEVGQELVGKLLEMKLAQNPNMTVEEWSKTKQEFMVFVFAEMLKFKPELMQEMGGHLYNELNK